MVCVPLVSVLAGVVLVVFGLTPKILMGTVPVVETAAVERKKKNQTAKTATSKNAMLSAVIRIFRLNDIATDYKGMDTQLVTPPEVFEANPPEAAHAEGFGVVYVGAFAGLAAAGTFGVVKPVVCVKELILDWQPPPLHAIKSKLSRRGLMVLSIK